MILTFLSAGDCANESTIVYFPPDFPTDPVSVAILTQEPTNCLCNLLVLNVFRVNVERTGVEPVKNFKKNFIP